MSATVSVNGHIASDKDAVIPVFDHGFLYGEGIYETLRTYGRKPFLYDRHMRRLRRSAEMIELALPFSDEDLLAEISRTMDVAALEGEAYIRVLVTRGIGELTYDIAATPAPSVVIIVKAHTELPAETYVNGVAVAIVGVVRNHPGSVSPMIKSNNLLNCALAMQEAYRKGAFEGVMRNYLGQLAECTTANLFVVRNGIVMTPPLSAGLLPGITREYVFDLGWELGLDVREQVLFDADLLGADEAFLTGTTRELVPITTVDGITIGSGTAGPITLRLLEAFRRAAGAG